MVAEEVKKATAGFIVSLIAGIFILINAIIIVVGAAFIEDIIGVVPELSLLTGMLAGVAAVAFIFAGLVIIGAILIYMPGKEKIGGILVLVFSILSIFFGGGLFIGMILGIIGGVLGLMKK